VDVSPEMVELARRTLAGRPNARAEVASGADLAQFPDESFDFCYSYAVFQHIPSHKVVLSYLRDARRVLKPGGILKCQFNGHPKADAHSADTWSGVRFSADEVREFCREHDFQLLLLDGIDTLNLWVTARKRPNGWSHSLQPAPGARLFGVGNTYTSDLVVPSAGRFSSASLWLENLSDDADLNNLEVEIVAQPESLRARPCYIGAYRGNGPMQVNVYLPPGAPTGPVPVRLWMLGEPVSNFSRVRVVPPPPRVPRLLSVTDGINILSGTRIETRSIKAQAEEVGPAPSFHADIDGVDLEDMELFCVDRVPERYMLNARVPAAIPRGAHRLHIRIGPRAFAPVEIEIAE
jgi:SAM-dependent methyltransferase